MWMKYEGFSKIMALDFSVSEHIYRNEGDFLRFCSPKFLAPGMSTKLLQKSSGNFIFLTQTTSWPLGITAQDISACAFAQNFSPFSSPSTKQFYLMHTTLPSVSFLYNAYLYNAPNEDYVGTEGVLGIISVLPAVRSLCQRHSQGGIWIDLKCKK